MQQRHTTRRRLRLVSMAVATIAVAALASACGSTSSSGSSGGSSRTALTLADGAQTASAFNAPYNSFAEENYWKQSGLDVTVQFTQGGTQSAQLVASGKADVSIVGMSSALTVAAQSPQVKIIGITGGNIWHLAVPKGSPITSIAQLKGKTVGVQALNTGSYLYNRAALSLSGVDPDSGVTWLPIGTGAQAADAINSGKVDAVATYDGPYELVSSLTKAGLQLLPSPLDTLDGSGAWIVNADVLKTKRDKIVTFMQGMSKTAVYSTIDPEAVIKGFWAAHPDAKPRGVTDAQAMTTTLGLVKAYWSKIDAVGPEGSYGVLSDDAVKKAVAFHLDNKIVKGTIDISKSVDLSVSQDADKYDKAPIQAAATTAKAAN